jgi:capsular exopolysaccharide synthesis family protein
MSKIFDSLRWAEDERNKRASRPETATEQPIERGRGARREASVSLDLPSEFVRELGILNNSLEPLLKDKLNRSILFTSPSVGEGTTTIATSFARFLAIRGMERILTVEMNARTPAFSKVFSINGDAGITEYFTASRDLASLVQTPKTSSVDVLHVGQTDPTLIQLYLPEFFPRLLREASEHYDTVIIDAPPVISCPETPQMASFVDGVVLVVQAGKTKREVAQRAIDSIAKFEGNLLGVVLNRKKYYIPEFLYKRL